MAVIPDAAAESRCNDLTAFNSAEAMRWRQRWHVSQHIIDVGWTSPSLQDGGHGQWGVEAVNVPMEWTGAARDDGSNLSGWFLTGVAEHSFSVFTLLEEIRQLIIASTLPVVKRIAVSYQCFI